MPKTCELCRRPGDPPKVPITVGTNVIIANAAASLHYDGRPQFHFVKVKWAANDTLSELLDTQVYPLTIEATKPKSLSKLCPSRAP